jgi:hypothetical protein
MSYTIRDHFVCKDPEWEVRYVDDDDGVSNVLVTALFDDILAFDGRWTAPEQTMTPEQCSRVLDRLADWVETRAPCRVPLIASPDRAKVWRHCTPRRNN